MPPSSDASSDLGEAARSGRHAVLFDLDGTLADPGNSIVLSVVAALDVLGLPSPTDDVLRTFVGPPLVDSFATLGLDESAVDRAVALYRAHFDAEGVRMYRPYPGMRGLVAELRADGVIVGIATSKPTPIAQQVLDALGWSSAFDVVTGASLDRSRRTKADVIASALERLDGVDDARPVGRVVMVGDRRHDVEGAHAHGLTCVGVEWGYGSPGELVAAGADLMVDSVESLRSALDRAFGLVGRVAR